MVHANEGGKQLTIPLKVAPRPEKKNANCLQLIAGIEKTGLGRARTISIGFARRCAAARTVSIG